MKIFNLFSEGDSLKNFLKIFFLFFFFNLLFLSCKQTEETEEITAEITAAQMEGRSRARDILVTNWKDTAQLQKKLLETKAVQSQYLIKGQKKSAEAFDSAFIKTIRTVNPKLYKAIQEDKNLQ